MEQILISILEKINGIRVLFDLGMEGLTQKVMRCFTMPEKYKKDKIDYICNIFPNEIAQPLRLYL